MKVFEDMSIDELRVKRTTIKDMIKSLSEGQRNRRLEIRKANGDVNVGKLQRDELVVASKITFLIYIRKCLEELIWYKKAKYPLDDVFVSEFLYDAMRAIDYLNEKGMPAYLINNADVNKYILYIIGYITNSNENID